MYDYRIGVCIEPLPKELPGCAVVQEKKVSDGQVNKVCVGRLNATTVVNSKSCRYSNLSNHVT